MPVNVIGTLKPKNNGKFPVAEAVDIKVTDDLRLDEALENKADLATVNFALAGKANASDFATSTANLQGQINQIIISSSAESVVAPEVAAARVGADGVTHATLKARCDSDATQLKEALTALSNGLSQQESRTGYVVVEQNCLAGSTISVSAESSTNIYHTGKNLWDSGSLPLYSYAWRTISTLEEMTHKVLLTAGKNYILSAKRDAGVSDWKFMVKAAKPDGTWIDDNSVLNYHMANKQSITAYNTSNKCFVTASNRTELIAFFAPTVDLYIDVVTEPGTSVGTDAMLEISDSSTQSQYEPYRLYGSVTGSTAASFTARSGANVVQSTNSSVTCTFGKSPASAIESLETFATNTDQKISVIESDVSAINGRFDIDYSLFELGNISISASGWTYSNSDKRVRTKQNSTIHLNAGDVFSLSDYTNAEYYVGWRKSDETYSQAGWISRDFTATETGDYVFVIRNKVESTITDISAILDLMKIERGYSLIDDKVQRFGASLHFWKKMFNLMHNSSEDKYVSSSNRLSIAEILQFNRDISISAKSGYRFAIHTRNIDGSFASDSGWQTGYRVKAGTKFTATFSRTDNGNISIAERINFYFEKIDIGNEHLTEIYKSIPHNGVLRSVNHRGYNDVAPENTLPAFKLSKIVGFDCVETDVSFTSDGVPVLLHDNTIDRTSDGTGAISDFTYQQLLQYDFGSWKSEEYAGTKIPTLEEFFSLCKRIGLKAYVELKPYEYTEEQIKSCVKIASKTGMLKNVSWISFNATYLQYIRNVCPSARVGYVVDAISDVSEIALVISSFAEYADAFLSVNYLSITDDLVIACAEAGVSIEAWTIDSIPALVTMSDSISAVTSDKLIAGDFLSYAEEIGIENLLI